jgi:ABC-type antimicrobial peptide transport system permease subunit
MSENSLTANLVLKNRISVYDDIDKMDKQFITITDRMFRLMGENYPVSITLPLKEMVLGFLYLKNFLDNINNIVVFILIVLGVLLIYSLMNSNVDEKTYEFGMMRTLGLPKKAIRLLLVL